MAPAQLKELLLQSLEHEGGSVLVYQTALTCGRNRIFELSGSSIWTRPRRTLRS